MASKRVAVIGAGASGLAAIKACLDEGLSPVCFERTDGLGGLWRYTDEPIEGQGCVMKSTVINTSKEMMTYSDFSVPENYPNYMHHTQVHEYFKLYTEHFGLEQHINYHEEVLYVKKAEDYVQSGRWEIKHRNRKSGQEKLQVFDGVLVCSGHHADKHMPPFPGLNEFKGQVLHSHDYRASEGHHDKRVLVIGVGNSGGDAAVEISRRASQVFLSTRSGTWIFSRVSHRGYPMDMLLLTRPIACLIKHLPRLMDMLLRRQLNDRFDHVLYSLRPKHGPLSQAVTINDDMPSRIICGSIQIKTDIKRFTSRGVEFVDGTFEDNIDLVILATGYSFGFPFIDKEGVTSLPSRGMMWDDIKNKEAAVARRYVKSQRHTIQVDSISFMDELAQLIGCHLGFVDLLKDPLLALKVMFGPVTPYTYRLTGPGKWAGARHAIMTQWRRVEAPLKTRSVPLARHSGVTDSCVICLCLAFAFFLLWFMFG
ncbi:hypothetical protein BsWGS_08676 [Bradybaena similaris]